MNDEDYIKKWLDDSLTKEEKLLFEQTEDYLFMEKLSQSLQYFRAPQYNVQNEYKRLALVKRKETKVISIFRTATWYKIAASIILLIGLIYYFLPGSEEKEENLAFRQTELTLPDETMVKLNSFSTLSFNEESWDDNRKAYLDGEGFFEVSKGAKFDIVSSSGTVSVLGTAFNIKDRKGFYEVHCYHGLVNVKTAHNEVQLTKNQTYRLQDGIEEIFESDEESTPSWMRNESAFESVAYYQVLEELQRQYPIKLDIQIKETNLKFTGKFPHSNLTLALQSITTPLNISYEVIDDQVRLFSDSKHQ